MSRIVLALLLFAFPAAGSGQGDEPVPKPEVRVGDSWTYRGKGLLSPDVDVYETRVTHVDDKSIQVVSTRKSDGHEVDSIWTTAWNAVVSYTGFAYKPETGFFVFPLKIGSKHTAEYDLTNLRNRLVQSRAELTVTVVGWEEIVVPAGKFRAVKVTGEAIIRPVSGFGIVTQRVTFWYVPEVERWVKLHAAISSIGEVGEELLEYKLK